MDIKREEEGEKKEKEIHRPNKKGGNQERKRKKEMTG